MAKDERGEIFKDIILGLRKKFIHSDKEQFRCTGFDKGWIC
jgi:hypothetical protein